MLAPDDRSMLLDLLAPPEDCELDAAVAVTYSLDLETLLSVPTAFAVTGAIGEDGLKAELAPVELLDALRTHASKLTICCDSAAVKVPARAGAAIFGLLDTCLLPVVAPRGGAFHPKMWIARYVDASGSPIHRVLVSSRNLTFDRSWDIIVSLEEETGGVPLPAAADFLVTLAAAGLTVSPADERHTSRMEKLADSVRRARFAIPAGFDDMRLHVLGLSPQRRTPSPLPPAAHRALVVSPFLARNTVESIPVDWDQLVCVSRPDQLEAQLGPLVYEGFEIDGRVLNPAADDGAPESDSLSGLHAKLWVHDLGGGRSSVHVGSANATNAAFDSNVEVLLELKGRTRDVGTDVWLSGDDSMAPLLAEHIWNSADVEPEDQVEAKLDEARRVIGRMRIQGEVTPATSGRFQLHLWCDDALPAEPGLRASVRPLALTSWTPQKDRIDASFELEAAALTAFVAVRLELEGEQQDFLLVADVTGMPQERDGLLLAHLLADPERLVRYLLLLLADPLLDRFDGHLQRALERSAGLSRASLPTVPLLEVMVRALVRRPQRLKDVDRLIGELKAGSDLLDADLADLWDSVRHVADLGMES